MALRAMIRLASILSLALTCGGCVAAAPAAVVLVTMAAIPGARDELKQTGALVEAPAEAAPAAGAPDPEDAPRAGAAGDEAPVPPGLMRLESLPAQSLPPGACALFLFSRADTPDFIFYALSDAPEGLVQLNGTPIRLRRFAQTEEDGLLTQSYIGSYAGEGELEARLRLTLGEALADGRRIPEASIRLSRPGADTLVTPATGLIACEPD